MREHCACKSHRKANFAFKLTTKSTGLKPILGSPNSTNESMFSISEFEKGLIKSIERIKKMNYRWILVEEKLEKNLLEIYVAVMLESIFNTLISKIKFNMIIPFPFKI